MSEHVPPVSETAEAGHTSQPPGASYTVEQISDALRRSLYAKTGNLAIEGIIADLAKALPNGGEYPSPTK